MRTLVVVPTYQEAASVVEVLHRLRAAAMCDVLVVDDNSPDGTADLADAAAEELGGISVLRRPAKAGLGSAYRDGFRWGQSQGYEVMVEMDADQSHDPAALPGILEPLSNGADLVIGSRYVPGASLPPWSAWRRALSRWGNRYANAVLGLGISDATSGYRAYRAATLSRIDVDTVRADGYGFQIETAYRVVQAGGKVVEVPIHFTDRSEGTSKMSVRIILEALVLVSAWGVRDRLWPAPRPDTMGRGRGARRTG